MGITGNPVQAIVGIGFSRNTSGIRQDGRVSNPLRPLRPLRHCDLATLRHCGTDRPGVLHSWVHFVVHFSGLVLLARALATGDAAVILQVFQNNGFASTPARE